MATVRTVIVRTLAHSGKAYQFRVLLAMVQDLGARPELQEALQEMIRDRTLIAAGEHTFRLRQKKRRK